MIVSPGLRTRSIYPRCSLPILAGAALLFGAGCVRERPKAPAAAQGGLPGPADSLIPDGPLGTSIRRGRALLLATRDSLPLYVGNRLRCASCHLDEGRRPTGSWIGVYARFPQYRSRRGGVELLEDRINDCFLRSMNGKTLPPLGPDIRDIVAYLAFLSRGVAVAPPEPSARLQQWAAFTADGGRGAAVFDSVCAKCHGKSGEGTAVAPPVWGPESYNIGAGMARVRTAAQFIRDNMPFDRPGALTDQQAFDVAAYINARQRPDFAGKENDWPNGDPPPDVAYPTRAAQRKAAARPQ